MNGKAKILLVDSCYEADSLSQYEFVRPVQRILERTGFPCQVCHISLLNEERLKSCDKVVLCGTALKDNEYLNHLERYTWLKEGDRPVLGICAGMQIIAAIFGGEVRSRHKPAIGQSLRLRGGCAFHASHQAAIHQGLLWLRESARCRGLGAVHREPFRCLAL